MAHKTPFRGRPFVALTLLVITGCAALGYARYRASVTAAKEAALRAELFKARDAIDAQKADFEKKRLSAVPPGKGTAR